MLRTTASIIPLRPLRQEEPIAESASMRELLSLATKVAASSIPVLILGETGSGKEVIARAIHHASRQPGDLVALNCAAIPENLAESELFGHVRGAFTGTQGDKRGLFEEANHGTILLDEAGELPLSTQAKLLRTLEEGAVRPVGATRSIPVSVRIIAATNRDLEDAVERGTFRQDLYFRLNGVTLEVPPLRNRPEDFELLLQHFLSEAAPGGSLPELAPGTIEALKGRSWRGNVRELRQCVLRAVALGGAVLSAKDFLPERARKDSPATLADLLAGLRWKEVERVMLTTAVERASTLRDAAAALGIPKSTLADRLRDYKITAPWMRRSRGERELALQEGSLADGR